MRDEFLAMLRGLKETDFGSHPNYVAMRALHAGLVKAGFRPEDASKVAGRLEVSVNQDFVDDKELFNEAIDSLVATICGMKREFDKIHTSLFWEAIQRPGLSLKYV